MYPSIDWRRYLLNKTSVQTQHNLNISGGTKDIRYFISLGFLYQNGLLKQFEGVGYDNNYKYKGIIIGPIWILMLLRLPR